MSDTQQLILDLIETSSLIGIDASAWVRQPTAIEAVAGKLIEQANSMLRFNDPKGIYSHCFCDIP